MAHEPLASVVIIFSNSEQFIHEAIDSVLAQTYRNFELLLVDDGSTDRSTEIAKQYTQEYPGKVRYLEHAGHRNRHMSASRNLGVKAAKGELIAFLDSDDVWFSHTLDRQVAILASQPEADMVYGSAQWWHSWEGNPDAGRRDFVDFAQGRGVPADTLYKPPTLLSLFLLDGQSVPCPSTMIVRREVFRRIGGFEESFCVATNGQYEDQAFYAKVCLNVPVFVTGECLAKYRQHPASCCSVGEHNGSVAAARRYYLNWLENYLSERGVTNRSVWNALQASVDSMQPSLPARLANRTRRILEQAYRTSKNLVSQGISRVPPSSRTEPAVPKAPRPGQVDFGSLRRLVPASLDWGFNRGTPIDRYYIEAFLANYAESIHGHVLEIGDDTYTRRYGGDRVTDRDILHVEQGHPGVTIVADLAHADHIPPGTFDCIIFTQTLHLIYDVRAAIRTLHRILRPGGVLLATIPGITRISHTEWKGSWYWRFTTASAQRLFGERFLPADIEAKSYGNVLAASSFLYGMAAEELSQEELEHHDPDYEVTITVRAVKSHAL